MLSFEIPKSSTLRNLMGSDPELGILESVGKVGVLTAKSFSQNRRVRTQFEQGFVICCAALTQGFHKHEATRQCTSKVRYGPRAKHLENRHRARNLRSYLNPQTPPTSNPERQNPNPKPYTLLLAVCSDFTGKDLYPHVAQDKSDANRIVH